MKILLTIRAHQTAPTPVALRFEQQGAVLIDQSIGALQVLRVMDASMDLDEIIVEIPQPPKELRELEAAALMFSEWATPTAGYLSFSPETMRWLRMAVGLLEKTTTYNLDTRTFTLQVREEEGIVVSFNRFNR